LYSLAM
jgi:extracellular elastinolytic metalloproteinase